MHGDKPKANKKEKSLREENDYTSIVYITISGYRETHFANLCWNNKSNILRMLYLLCTDILKRVSILNKISIWRISISIYCICFMAWRFKVKMGFDIHTIVLLDKFLIFLFINLKFVLSLTQPFLRKNQNNFVDSATDSSDFMIFSAKVQLNLKQTPV
jgi:hypothetical protein